MLKASFVFKDKFKAVYDIMKYDNFAISDRASLQYVLKEDCLQINIEAKDIVALRAIINSLLQRLDLVFKILSGGLENESKRYG